MERQGVALVLEQEFMSFEDFKHEMGEWAIDGGFTFFFQKSDTTRTIIKCRLQECPVYVRAAWNEQRRCVRVARVDAEHTCLGAALLVRSVASRQPRLWKIVPQLLLVQTSTKRAEIQNAIRLKYKTQID